ncbi:hypothetical protein AB4Z34_21425, partial [Ensifer sp. 2YAB10]|uniref:hypothetical protein n=1 Tax=Ensifer sp. 2YAB10 TaxID=3233021 RepID=UPI003F8F07F5
SDRSGLLIIFNKAAIRRLLFFRLLMAKKPEEPRNATDRHPYLSPCPVDTTADGHDPLRQAA